MTETMKQMIEEAKNKIATGKTYATSARKLADNTTICCSVRVAYTGGWRTEKTGLRVEWLINGKHRSKKAVEFAFSIQK